MAINPFPSLPLPLSLPFCPETRGKKHEVRSCFATDRKDLYTHAGGKQRRGNGRLGKGGQFKQKINHRRWESGRRWIAFNRVSRWPLLFSRKNHRNEIASLSIIRISFSLSLSRCATNVVSPCFLTREDYFGYCVECFRFLETERSVLIAINSQWWWGGGEEEVSRVPFIYRLSRLSWLFSRSRSFRYYPWFLEASRIYALFF